MPGLKLIRFDFVQIVRNRTLLWFSVIYTLVGSGFIYYGAQYNNLYDGLNQTLLLLLNLNLFLLPLIILIQGSMTISNEKENGWFALIYTFPLKRSQYIFARIVALTISMLVIVCIGFGIAALVGAFISASLPVTDFLFLALLSFILIVLFCPLSVMIGYVVKNRVQGMTYALTLWSFFVLIYDFLAMFALSFVPAYMMGSALTITVLLNPIQIVRILAIMYLDNGVILGPSLYEFTLFFQSSVGISLILLSIMLWIFIPTLIILYLMKRGSLND